MQSEQLLTESQVFEDEILPGARLTARNMKSRTLALMLGTDFTSMNFTLCDRSLRCRAGYAC